MNNVDEILAMQRKDRRKKTKRGMVPTKRAIYFSQAKESWGNTEGEMPDRERVLAMFVAMSPGQMRLSEAMDVTEIPRTTMEGYIRYWINAGKMRADKRPNDCLYEATEEATDE